MKKSALKGTGRKNEIKQLFFGKVLLSKVIVK
jgi:hypothetical protein